MDLFVTSNLPSALRKKTAEGIIMTKERKHTFAAAPVSLASARSLI